jgi:hypothetical protein
MGRPGVVVRGGGHSRHEEIPKLAGWGHPKQPLLIGLRDVLGIFLVGPLMLFRKRTSTEVAPDAPCFIMLLGISREVGTSTTRR